MLIRALCTQVHLNFRDATRNIKEMLVLFRELLALNLSASFPEDVCSYLTAAVCADSLLGRIQLLDQAIECLRDAAKICSPDSYIVSLALARALLTRFSETHSNDDYEEAMPLLERMLDPNQPGECPDSIRDEALLLATSLAVGRSAIFNDKDPAYSEVSISRLRTLLNSSSIPEQLRPGFARIFVMQARERSRKYSLSETSKKKSPISHKSPTFHSWKARKHLSIQYLCPIVTFIRHIR